MKFRKWLLKVVGFQAIAEALGLAAIKAAVSITAIIAGGRLIADNQNAGIFSANTLFVVLGTSLLIARVGMSIDPKLLLSNFPVIMGTLGLLIFGKTLLVALIGKIFAFCIKHAWMAYYHSYKGFRHDWSEAVCPESD
ncbi:hypothetical protein TSUD_90310 [Trifolium subterraneum]|uniref:Cation/H+ exchanger domain-containing protein n=1 Tax=Trifolium subterraneum TaxID=3900 RepID=A0A2Z6NZ42_TRISU|nr:hypothetical protein TSUD_90310 [Trifolium subterraneum]